MSDNKSIHKFKAGDVFHERYTLEKLIGVGGFADVWRATDNKTHTTVALKIYTNLDEDTLSHLLSERQHRLIPPLSFCLSSCQGYLRHRTS